MTEARFKEAVAVHNQIKRLEGSLWILEKKEAASLVFEGNSPKVAAEMKAALIADLKDQIAQEKQKLVEILSGS